MGSVRNTYAPFNIYYRLTNETFDGPPTEEDDLGITPYDGDTYTCDTAPPVNLLNYMHNFS